MGDGWIAKTAARVRQRVRKIQRSNDRTKRRWLIGTTAVTMVAIIVLWVGYLNLTVPPLASPTEELASESETTEPDESFLTVFSRGIIVLGSQVGNVFSDAWRAIAETATRVREFSFEGDGTTPSVTQPESLPPTPLP